MIREAQDTGVALPGPAFPGSAHFWDLTPVLFKASVSSLSSTLVDPMECSVSLALGRTHTLIFASLLLLLPNTNPVVVRKTATTSNCSLGPGPGPQHLETNS
jgi:hypothetical protein